MSCHMPTPDDTNPTDATTLDDTKPSNATTLEDWEKQEVIESLIALEMLS